MIKKTVSIKTPLQGTMFCLNKQTKNLVIPITRKSRDKTGGVCV